MRRPLPVGHCSSFCRWDNAGYANSASLCLLPVPVHLYDTGPSIKWFCSWKVLETTVEEGKNKKHWLVGTHCNSYTSSVMCCGSAWLFRWTVLQQGHPACGIPAWEIIVGLFNMKRNWLYFIFSDLTGNWKRMGVIIKKGDVRRCTFLSRNSYPVLWTPVAMPLLVQVCVYYDYMNKSLCVSWMCICNIFLPRAHKHVQHVQSFLR